MGFDSQKYVYHLNHLWLFYQINPAYTPLSENSCVKVVEL